MDLVKLVLNNNVRELEATKANSGGVTLPNSGGVILPSGAIAR